MASEKVEAVLLRHFDEHQKSSGRRSLSIEARVEAIYSEIDEVELQAKVESVNLSDHHDDGSIEDTNQVLSSTLIHFLDCSLVTEVSIDTKESIEAIQELVLAVASQRVEVARTVLQDRLLALTVVLLERVRGSACRCIGWIVKYLLECPDIRKTDLDELLDKASQALLPRFTDKTQAVRQSAIEASRFFFGNAAGTSEGEMDDPDIRQCLQWSLQHDPSVTNRVAALEALPVTLQTMDVILTRVRDVKSKVRIAAVQTLRQCVPDLHKWEAEQCAELIESGWTDRCAATKAEIEQTVFAWLKSCGFDVLAMLRHLNVIGFEESCKKVMTILLNSQDDLLADTWSEVDVAAFKRGIQQTSGKLVLVNQSLQPEQIFMLQSRCVQAEKLEPRKKEMILSEILPDVPEICAMFELHASALTQAIAEEKDAKVIDRFESICLGLLSMVKSADIEEGSRLHLKTMLKGMLESIIMPEDLVEGSIETLHRIHRVEEDFWEAALSILQALKAQQERDEEDGLADNRTLRILSILCTVFEKSSSGLASSGIMEDFTEYVTPTVSHENALIREAAVSCLGKMGLFTKQEIVRSEFKPMLLERVLDEDEKLSIRAQAMLGLSDWSVLFSDFLSASNNEESVQGVLSDIMNHTELSLACVAAEVTCKLLYSGKFFDELSLARLLVLFFDPRLTAADEEDDSNEAKEIGSPIRLQQLLSQFFPLFCLRKEEGRRKFISCTKSALEIVFTKDGGKRRRGTKAFPVVKMIEFLTATADEALNVLNQKKAEGEKTTGESSTELLMAIQLCKFLACNSDDLNVTTLRTLCKILGATEVNTEQDKLSDLRVLVDGVENLGNCITDELCLNHLAMLNDAVDEIDIPDESMLADDESLNDAMERVHISPSRGTPDKENTSNKKPETSEKRNSIASTTFRPSRLSTSSLNEA